MQVFEKYRDIALNWSKLKLIHKNILSGRS